LEGLSEALAQELDPKWGIKITIVAPGPFKTEGIFESAAVDPVHPAYTDESLASWQQRRLPQNGVANGDSVKAVAVIEKLAHLEDPPLRLPLHKLAVDSAKQKAARIQKETEAYEAWSDNIYIE
ncbi:hypothetical protein HYDPIDRAFT_26100, partial [Hydnomerulius pinastri MD-312]